MSFRLFFLASLITAPTISKLNFPSTGSIIAHEIPAITELRLLLVNAGQIGFIYSRLVAALLVSSPQRAINGLPSTINCLEVPCSFREGIGMIDCFEQLMLSKDKNIMNA